MSADHDGLAARVATARRRSPFELTMAGASSVLAVRRFQATERLATPYAVTVLADLPPGEELPGEPLGGRAHLDVPLADGTRRTFHGIVTEIEEQHRQIDGSRAFELVLEPRLAELRHTRHRRIFHELTSVDVARTILREHGVTHRVRLVGEYPVHTHRIQYDESDLAFVERILFEEGIFYFFDHPATASTDDPDATNLGASEVLVLCDTAAYYPDMAIPRLVRRGSGTGEGTIGDPTTCSDASRRRRLRTSAAIVQGATVAAPSSALGDARDLRTTASTELPEIAVRRPRLVIDHEGSLEDRPANVRPSLGLLDEARGDADQSVLRTHCPHAMPGRAFVLESAEHDDAEHVVVAVEHRGEAARQFTTGGEGDTYDNTVVTAPRSTTLRAARRPKPRCDGLDTAVVVGPAGQEIWTDELGRVKVQFVWDRSSAYDDRSSAWLRVAQAWGGAGFGAQFLPRIGMEVLVGFVAGDVDRPIVVGCLHNGVSPPPFRYPDEKTKLGIRSRTSPGAGGFSEIVIDDRRDQESVSVRSQRDLMVQVLGEQNVQVAGGSTETVGTRTESILGNATRDVGGAHVERIAGSESRAVGGACTYSLGGDVSFEAAGSVDQRVGQRGSLIVGGNLDVVAGAAEGGGSMSLRSAASLGLGAVHAIDLVAGFAIRMRVGDNVVELNREGLHVQAKRFTVKAERIDLVGGGASLLLAGNAGLTGGEVIASSKGSQLKLDADAHLDGALVLLNCGAGAPAGASAGLSDERGTLTFQVVDPKAMVVGRKYVMRIAGPEGAVAEHPVDVDGKVVVEGRKGERFTLVELLCDGKPVGMTEV